ncbi:MAG: UvrD-helicase domain-containing protein, partial [Acidimicrobiales bacterium]
VSGRASIDRVAVITFGEAAAAELRSRLFDELEQIARLETARAARARKALFDFDGATITTLHSFARRILAEHPFAAGLPAQFEVLDPARSLAELDESWEETLDALVAREPGRTALQWSVLAGATLATLRGFARRMGESWDGLRRAQVGTRVLPPVSVTGVLAPLEEAMSLAGSCVDGEDRLLAHLVGLEPYRDRLRTLSASGDGLAVLGALVGRAPKLRGGAAGRKAAWSGRKDDVVALLIEADEAREQVVSTAVGEALATVAARLGDLVVEDARRRARVGRLQYHDLLVLARDLVRDEAHVRSTLHERYTHLFVDEMQDTDPLQVELVTMIAAEPEAPVGHAPWGALETTPGATFFVGDPMQSIYGFRRADVGAFLDVVERVGTPEIALTTNFRSVPGIVEWVNRVFGALVGPGEHGLQPPFEHSDPIRDAGTGAPVPVTIIGAGEERPRTSAEVRAREADDVAAAIVEMVGARWPVGKEGRAVQLDDVTVLVRTRASIPALEDAFGARGIAYRLEASSYVYGASEVRDLFHVLRAIDDPMDTRSVVAALRSPGLGCGDDDLLRYRMAGGTWDYRTAPPGGLGDDAPVVAGLARLRTLSEARPFVPVSELVGRVVDEMRQFEAALDTRRWQEEWRRLRFVLDQARAFTETSSGGLHQYLRWVAVQSEDDARVAEVIVPEAGTPAVTVMTVHAAKGLEFPVVAVLGFGAEPRGVVGPVLLIGEDGPEIALRQGMCSPGYETARALEEKKAGLELVRLFYVAVTRAENHLLVSVQRTAREPARESVAARVIGALDDTLAGEDDTSLDDTLAGRADDTLAGGLDTSQAGGLPATHPHSGTAVSFARWREERGERFCEPPTVVAATGVAKLVDAAAEVGSRAQDAAAQDAETGDATSGARAPWRRGRAGTALGRAVHAVLQSGDLATLDDFDLLALAHAVTEGIPERARDVSRIARAGATSDLVRRAVSGKYWREIYVGVPVGERVLEGFVDLLFEGEDGLEVVDYKTDLVRDDEDVERLVERYRLQAAAYALGVELASGRKVQRCTLLFLRGTGSLARPVPRLTEAVSDVRSVMGNGSGHA